MSYGDPPILTTGILDRLLDKLRQAGAPVVDQFSPGIARDELEEVFRSVGLRPTAELETFFGWRNGVVVGSGVAVLGPFLPYPVEHLAAHCLQAKATYASVAEEMDVPSYWQQNWFPLVLTDTRADLVCECPLVDSSDDDEATPVVGADVELSESDYSHAASLGEVATWWIRALDCGAWSWDAQGLFQYDFSRLEEIDPDRRHEGLL